MTWELREGHVLDLLRAMPTESVQCVVTSPPYCGLRAYKTEPQIWGGNAGHLHRWDTSYAHSVEYVQGNPEFARPHREQKSFTILTSFCSCGAWRGELGSEPTPELFVSHLVEVFKEVKRVLRSDGTLWLNLGDSYAGSAQGWGHGGQSVGSKQRTNVGSLNQPLTEEKIGFARPPGYISSRQSNGLKPKDLVGIPWRVAFALQQPYYTGRIKDEGERIWLAAMIEAEGCMFIHKRKEGQSNGQGYVRKNASYGVGLEVCNTSERVINRVMEIVKKGSICSQGPTENYRRKQRLYRWNLRTNECRDVIREVYPYLVGKKQQARLVLGCPSSGTQAEAAHSALIGLHNGVPTTIDFPEPPSMYEPGFYLRSDIIWSKNNPMPESVTDRPTKAHEYLFLFTKSAQYFYDQESVREPYADASEVRYRQALRAGRSYATKEPYKLNTPYAGFYKRGEGAVQSRGDDADGLVVGGGQSGRNLRSVWTIPTQPYSESHFATFPEKLVEPCIRAGTSERGCCGKCGAPWEREVIVEKSVPTNNMSKVRATQQGQDKTMIYPVRYETTTTTMGWHPTCSCQAETTPCLILDPFAGSGTVGVVALKLQRDFIGIDLSHEYCQMARTRLGAVMPLFDPPKNTS